MRSQGDLARSISNDSPQRPTGITIVSVLGIIGGALGVLLSLVVIVLTAQNPSTPGNPRDPFSGLFGAAVVVLIMSVPTVIINIGLFQMKGWARILIVILSIITILLVVFTIWNTIQNGDSMGSAAPVLAPELIIAAINVLVIYVVVARK